MILVDVLVLICVVQSLAARKMQPDHMYVELEDVQEAVSILNKDQKQDMIKGITSTATHTLSLTQPPGLTPLELCLVIAAKIVQIDKSANAINFNAVYEEYHLFQKHHATTIPLFPKPVAMKAFERLVEVELFRLDDGHAPKEYRTGTMLIEPEQITAGVEDNMRCTTVMKQWATRHVD